MKMPISEIADRYSIALLKKERADAQNQKEIDDLNIYIYIKSHRCGFN